MVAVIFVVVVFNRRLSPLSSLYLSIVVAFVSVIVVIVVFATAFLWSSLCLFRRVCFYRGCYLCRRFFVALVVTGGYVVIAVFLPSLPSFSFCRRRRSSSPLSF